jgi:hypothetical protein
MSSDFKGFGILFTGLAAFLGVASPVVGLTFFGPCALFGMAGLGLLELGRELFGREPPLLLLPSFLFINAVI